MVDRPGVNWVGAHPANFERARGGIALEAVVLHVTDGGMPGPWFNDPRAQASTHFGVSKVGRIEAYVLLSDTAHAQGAVEVEEARARHLIRDNWGINPNLWASSVEFEGTRDEVRAGRVPTPEQESAAVRLVAWLFQDVLRDGRGVRPLPSRETILMHRDISPRSRACPVWGEEVQERIIARVRALLAAAAAPLPLTRARNLEDALTLQAVDLERRADLLQDHAAALRVQATSLRRLLAAS
jgi:hypothetical protein